MAQILGRSIGAWGVMAAIAGAAVLIPSAISLALALVAAAGAVV